MAARRQDPRAHGDEREIIRRRNEDEPVPTVRPLDPSQLAAMGKMLGYGANAVSKLAAIYEADGIAKASSALVDEAALLFKGTSRSLAQAVREFNKNVKRLAAGRAPIRRVEDSTLLEVAPPSAAAHERRVAQLIEERAATPKSQSQVMREAAQAKRDLVRPPSQRTIQARALKANRDAAAECERKATLQKSLSMRSRPGDVLNKENLPLKEEIGTGNYRSHRPPQFDEAEIERGTASERAFKTMRSRHSPNRVSEAPSGRKVGGGANSGGDRTWGEETKYAKKAPATSDVAHEARSFNGEAADRARSVSQMARQVTATREVIKAADSVAAKLKKVTSTQHAPSQ